MLISQLIMTIYVRRFIATASKSIVKYGINYGFQYNIGETYTDTYSGTSNRLGLIFTATSSFLPGDIITIDKNNWL